MLLFDHQTEDAVSPEFTINDRIETVVLFGDFGGGTVSFEASTANTGWQQLRFQSGGLASFTENVITNIAQLKAKVFKVRARLTGSTGADLVAEIY